MENFQAPAFIADAYWDVIAINKAIADIYDLTVESFTESSDSPITQFNMMRILFSPQFDEQKKLLGNEWEKFALNTALLFRTSSLRYRSR